MLSDYNCRILEFNKYKFYFGDESTIRAEYNKIISDINDLGTCGFHKLVCPVRYDEKIAASKANKIISEFKKSLLKNSMHKLNGCFKISYVPLICLTDTSPLIKDLDKLCVGGSDYIFIEMPISSMPEHLPSTINKILYSCKLSPVFTRFHIYRSIYPETEIAKLINIKHAAFQFGIKQALFSENILLIKQILKNGKTVLLGTETDHSEFNPKELSKNLEALKKLLGDSYLELTLKAHSFVM